MDDPLAHRPGYALRRAANAMMGELAARLAAINLRIAEASVLLLVDTHDSMTASDIGRVLDIRRANMVPLLGRLEAAGLVARAPIDGKSRAIVLTDEGLARRRQADAITLAFEQDLMARLPAEMRDGFVASLNRLWS